VNFKGPNIIHVDYNDPDSKFGLVVMRAKSNNAKMPQLTFFIGYHMLRIKERLQVVKKSSTIQGKKESFMEKSEKLFKFYE